MMKARSQDTRRVVLDEQGWDPAILTQIKVLLKEVALDAGAYRYQLEQERAALKPGERWEYSVLTPSRWPLICVRDEYICISLALLANVFCDGLYHRMLTACGGDAKRVNAFTELFGKLFHEYVHDLWERVAGADKVHRLWGAGGEEFGDGVIEAPDGLIIYDAKSRRPTRQVTSSGNIDAFFEDMEKGVLNGARQLDAAIKQLRGEVLRNAHRGLDVSHIFPVIVTARHFPEVGFVYDRIDRILHAEGLLQDAGVEPLVVIDTQTLEIMEGLRETGEDVLTLLTQKAVTPHRRVRSLDSLIYEERRALPSPRRMQQVFGILGPCLLAWLRSARIDEETIDGILYPPDG
jgi:hypothetical protein